MNSTLYIQIKEIHLGQINTLHGFESFLYKNGEIADLFSQEMQSQVLPTVADEKSVWFVNPTFQQLCLANNYHDVSVFKDSPNWLLSVLQSISEQHQNHPVFLGASDGGGNFVTCEITEFFPPDGFFTSIRLHDLLTRTQANFSAKQRSGSIAILDCCKGRDSGDVEKFLRTSGIAHSPEVFINPTDSSSGLTNLIQLARMIFSIENRTHYRGPSKPIPWFTDGITNQRTGLLMNLDSLSQWMLEISAPEATLEPRKINRNQYLVTAAGNSEEELLQQLGKIAAWVQQGQPVASIEKMTWKANQDQPQKYRLCLVAHTSEKLMDEIEQARKGIPSSLQSGKEWQSRGGSY
ncbi:MAG: hypothetical protein V2J07_04620, partial [Anaerolineae bacterium]|nr:hypothetical protein [Anaerolineae bacterium]